MPHSVHNIDARRSIYLVEGPGGVYVGVTLNPARRWGLHLSRVRNGSELPLHRAIREHGAAAFAMRVVAEAQGWDNACSTETALIHQLRAEGVALFNQHVRKLTDEQEVDLWVRRLMGEPIEALAREFGLATGTISAEYGFYRVMSGGAKGRNLSRKARALGRREITRRVRRALNLSEAA